MLKSSACSASSVVAATIPARMSPLARADRLGDEREHALRVGLAADAGAVRAEPLVEPVERADDAVVGEHAAVERERVGVGFADLAGVGVADVGEERRGVRLARLARELLVVRRPHRAAEQARLARGAERREPEPVGVGVALVGERGRGVEQPERRVDVARPGVQSEQAAHGDVSPPREAARPGTAGSAPPATRPGPAGRTPAARSAWSRAAPRAATRGGPGGRPSRRRRAA